MSSYDFHPHRRVFARDLGLSIPLKTETDALYTAALTSEMGQRMKESNIICSCPIGRLSEDAVRTYIADHQSKQSLLATQTANLEMIYHTYKEMHDAALRLPHDERVCGISVAYDAIDEAIQTLDQVETGRQSVAEGLGKAYSIWDELRSRDQHLSHESRDSEGRRTMVGCGAKLSSREPKGLRILGQPDISFIFEALKEDLGGFLQSLELSEEYRKSSYESTGTGHQRDYGDAGRPREGKRARRRAYRGDGRQ